MSITGPETEQTDWWTAPLSILGGVGGTLIGSAAGMPWLGALAAGALGTGGAIGGRAIAEAQDDRAIPGSGKSQANRMYSQGVNTLGGIGQQALGKSLAQKAAMEQFEKQIGMPMSDVPEDYRNLMLAMMRMRA